MIFNYKGFTGKVVLDKEEKFFHGEIENIKDVVTFQGETIEQASREFENSVEDYLEFSKEEN